MALSRVKTWTSEVLTSSDLNAEFNNILNNALSLISPLTSDLAAGGNKITGLSLGSVSSPSLQFTGDTNTGIYSSGADTVDIATGGLQVISVTGTSSTRTTMVVQSTEPGANGPSLYLQHNSASPADDDVAGLLEFRANDDGAATRIVGQVLCQFTDVTSTTMDSQLGFKVMNAVNAGDVNTTALLSSLGVWTDASAAASKRYIGDVDGVLGKIKALKTLGVYVGVNTPAEKLATAERHFSPTAEDFYDAFGIGIHPSKAIHPGIAPKDLACIALKGLLELDARVAALEAK